MLFWESGGGAKTMRTNSAWWWLMCAACGPAMEPLPPSDMPQPSAQPASTAAPGRAELPSDDEARRFTLRDHHNASDGSAPASLEVLTLSGGSRFGRDQHTHLYALVLAGEASVEVEPEGRREPLQAWSALWAPGAGITLHGSNARVLLAFVSDGSGAGSYDASPARSWQTRPAPGALALRHLATVEPLSWADGRMHVRLGFEHGPASLSLLYGDADVPVAAHRHERSWEVIGLLAAGGSLRHARSAAGSLEDGPRVPLHNGTSVAIAPAWLHSFEPDDKTPLFAVQLYVPAGPEQRFKQLAAGTE